MDLLNEAIFLGIGHEHDSVRSFANGGAGALHISNINNYNQ